MKNQINNWNSYKRKQCNINKAVRNDSVSSLVQQNYRMLHIKLKVKDESLFNDTYLKLTYNYNPEQDFIEQFTYYYNLLKGAYYRDDKVSNYQNQPIVIEPSDTVDEVKIKHNTNFIEQLKDAISKERSKKEAN